ncbi:MAG: hypothetical protein WC544_02455 [Patescibacteria group bacterium]
MNKLFLLFILLVPLVAFAQTAVDEVEISSFELGVACDDFGNPFPLLVYFCGFVAIILMLIGASYVVNLIAINRKMRQISASEQEKNQKVDEQQQQNEARKIKIKKPLMRVVTALVFFVLLGFIFNWLGIQRWSLGCGIYSHPSYKLEADHDNYYDIYEAELAEYAKTMEAANTILLIIGGLLLAGFLFVTFYIKKQRKLYPGEVLPDGKKKPHPRVSKLEIFRRSLVLVVVFVIILLVILIPVAWAFVGAHKII